MTIIVNPARVFRIPLLGRICNPTALSISIYNAQ